MDSEADPLDDEMQKVKRKKADRKDLAVKELIHPQVHQVVPVAPVGPEI